MKVLHLCLEAIPNVSEAPNCADLALGVRAAMTVLWVKDWNLLDAILAVPEDI